MCAVSNKWVLLGTIFVVCLYPFANSLDPDQAWQKSGLIWILTVWIYCNDYRDLEGTNVEWLCCKCDSINCDSFTFRSYELKTSNSFHPLTQINSSIDSVHSSVSSSLHTSSPKNRNNFSNSRKKYSTRSTSSTSSSTYHEPFHDMSKKQNLRVMNINCRSVKENKSELNGQ